MSVHMLVVVSSRPRRETGRNGPTILAVLCITGSQWMHPQKAEARFLCGSVAKDGRAFESKQHGAHGGVGGAELEGKRSTHDS